jgi:hypothetical protein
LSPRRRFWLPPPVARALIVARAGGGGNSQGPSSALDGTWAGGTASNGITFQIPMLLAEDDHGITGSGTISGSGPTCVGIRAAHDHV